MSKIVFAVFVLVFVAFLIVSEDCRAEGGVTSVEKNLFDAAVLLTSVEKDGKLRMCTATSFEREGTKYYFLTVAHCILKEGKPTDGESGL